MTGRPADPGRDTDLAALAATVREALIPSADEIAGILAPGHPGVPNWDLREKAIDALAELVARATQAEDDLAEEKRMHVENLRGLDDRALAAEAEAARLREERDAAMRAPMRFCLNVHGDMLCNGPQGHEGGCVFMPGWKLAREIEDELAKMVAYAGATTNELRETRGDRDEGWRQHNQAEIGRLNAEAKLRRAIATLEYMGGAELVVDELRHGSLPEPSEDEAWEKRSRER